MHLIRMFYVGESRKLFPTFFTVLLISAPVFAGQWYESIYSLMGFPQINQSVSSESYYHEKYISFSTGYDDVYRKKIYGKTTLTLAEQSNRVQFGLPWQIGKTRHLFTGELAEDFLYFNNLNDETSLISRCRIANTRIDARWIISRGSSIFSLGTEYSQSNMPFTINIKSFPESEDSQTNKYFFDLLEPTFGRELGSTLSLKNTGFSFWASTRLNRRWRIGVSMHYAGFDSDWRINYINSGQNGKRRIDIPMNGFDKVYRFSLLPNQSLLKDISITFFRDNIDYFIDNNRPNITDLKTLGQGDIGRSGSAININIEKQKWKISGGLSIANYDLDSFLRTPVLGYYLFFPISHSAEFNFSHGRSFSQQIGFDNNFDFRNINIRAGSVYTHALYDFWIKGTADLMLGLESTPLDYPFKYSLHLLDLHAEMEWRKGPFGLTYNFQQLIPIGRRLDDSPIRFTKKTPGVEYTNHGGQQHQINLGYYF